MELTLLLLKDETEVNRKNSIEKYEYDDLSNSLYSQWKNQICECDVGVKFIVTNESDDVSLKTNPSSKNTANHIVLESTDPNILISDIRTGSKSEILHKVTSNVETVLAENIPLIKSCDMETYHVFLDL